MCNGYSLEIFQQGISNEYPQYIFKEKLEKYQYILIAKNTLSGSLGNYKHLPRYGQFQQMTNWIYFSYFSQKIGCDTSCKLSP